MKRFQQSTEQNYAVAVRNGQLYLFLRIRRAPKGDVYVIIPTGRSSERQWKQWNPHASHHSTGHYHQKSFDRRFMPQQRQKLDASFHWTENLLTRGIAVDEPQAFGELCSTGQFSDFFEIPVADLRPEKYRTYISVDLTEPGGRPTIYPNAQILGQKVFQDAVPWIVVTLFETPPRA